MEDKQLLERGHVRQLEVEQQLERGNWIRDGYKIACKRKITVRLCELGDLLNLSCFLLKLSPHKGLGHNNHIYLYPNKECHLITKQRT